MPASSPAMPRRRGAEALVETLIAHGVDRAFCVPGESYLAVLDALHDTDAIQIVTARHEGGAGLMAVADAKLTGKPGVCFVSRGPGATNAAIALHTAEQDAVPLVLFVGQVERKDLGRNAFQEIDYGRTFGAFVKRVEEVQNANLLPEVTARAFAVAQSGTPGPVIISLPEDMLLDAADAPVPAPRAIARPRPGEADLSAVADRIAAAERPVVIAGGALRWNGGRAALAAASETWALPVVAGFRHQDLMDNASPRFAGHNGYGIPQALTEALHSADLVVAVGTRLGDVTTQGYSIPKPGQPLIHVYPDPDRIGTVFDTEMAISVDPVAFLEGLARRNAPPAPAGRAAWIERLHRIHADLAVFEGRPAEDGVDFGYVIDALGKALPPDAILSIDSGNFGGFCHRYFPFNGENTLIASVAGAMGLGVPGAVAAALRHPGRAVVALVGDGGFMMTGMEFATAVRDQLPVKVVISNNNAFATIRLHQERHFPNRTVATDLSNPDFARLAEAFGVPGFTVTTPAEAEQAVADALKTPGPAIIDVRTSLANISAFTTIDAARQAAKAVRAGA